MTVAVSEISDVNRTSVLLLVQNGKRAGISELEDEPFWAHPPVPGSWWNLQRFKRLIPGKKWEIAGMLSMVSSIQRKSDTILSIPGVPQIYPQTWVFVILKFRV
jgi:hypothetical protein